MIWDGDVGLRGIHIEHTIQMGRKVTIIGIGRWPSCSWRQCFCNLPYFDVCSTMNIDEYMHMPKFDFDLHLSEWGNVFGQQPELGNAREARYSCEAIRG